MGDADVLLAVAERLRARDALLTNLVRIVSHGEMACGKCTSQLRGLFHDHGLSGMFDGSTMSPAAATDCALTVAVEDRNVFMSREIRRRQKRVPVNQPSSSPRQSPLAYQQQQQEEKPEHRSRHHQRQQQQQQQGAFVIKPDQLESKPLRTIEQTSKALVPAFSRKAKRKIEDSEIVDVDAFARSGIMIPEPLSQPLKQRKFVAVERRKAERETMTAHACAQCKEWFEATGRDNTASPTTCSHLVDDQGHLQEVSRHRTHFTPPSTPEFYWNMNPATS